MRLRETFSREVTVNVRHAKDVARQWVIEEGSKAPGFHGAYFAGSTNWLPDDAPLPAASDLDVNLVVTGPNAPNKRAKFVYRDVLLEITYLPSDQLRSPDLILGHYHLAGGLSTPGIILDPSGQLTALQAAVSRGYAKRQWVRRRCEHARARVLQQLEALTESEPFPDQVIGWLFATGVTTHVLLAAGLRNPTVRRRYVAARELLADYGCLGFYEPLLELLGCAQMSRMRVEQHLAALTDMFDAARTVIKTPFPFASDISDVARPIAIGGSQDLIEQGYHREAVFWIAATYSRCQQALSVDAPVEMSEKSGRGYRQLIADLGITSFSDLQQRGEQVREHLPRVWEVAEAIMAADPAIED